MAVTPAFCTACGGSLTSQYRDGRERPVCESCGQVVYQNPIPSVAAILVREGRVLLVKRGIDPGFGRWSLPGGFVELGESPAEAVQREVHEETGLICKPQFVVDARSVLKGFYGDVIVICYYAEIVSGSLCAGEDASEVAEFGLEALPELAFTEHRNFILQFVNDQNKIQT